MRRLAVAGWVVLAAVACTEKSSPPLSALAPKPLPSLAGAAADAGDREEAYRVEPAPAFGDPRPEGAFVVELGHVALDSKAELSALEAKSGTAPLLLVPDADTYLAQLGAFFAWAEDAGREVWLAHPNGLVAYRVVLRDELQFQAWLSEPKPGKIRIIQRADGLELQTNIGKMPGTDPNGPTVPVRGGQLDIAAARRALERLKERFDDAPDLCLVPSFGTQLARAAQVLSADFTAAGKRTFDGLCLVYPRPSPRDGG